MYQSLIWPAVARDHARGLRTALDAKDGEGLPHALIDGVGRDAELCADLFG
jgi:hypothetical protein